MPVKTIDPETLKIWLDKGEAVLVDVREPAEYKAQNIPGSRLLPLGGVAKTTLPQTSGKRLVFHCKAGKRGASACQKLLEEIPNTEVYNLEGGIDAWTQAGYAVETSGRFFLPLDRQVQLTIGLLVFTGSLLSYFISPGFLLVTGLAGLGLINAGLTGWCGLAKLMAKMPWNQK